MRPSPLLSALFGIFLALSLYAKQTMDSILLWPKHPDRKAQLGAPCLLPFLHDGDEIRPCILVIPGGGYGCVCHGYEGSDVAEEFRALGFHAFVLDYRCGANGRYPAPQEDAARAIKLIRANAAKFHVNPDRIASLGFSAGGHLAGCLGTSIIDDVDASYGDEADAFSPRVNAMVLCYPVTQFDIANGHIGSGVNLLNTEDKAAYQPFTLMNRIDDKTPPTFLMHTFADQIVPVQGTLLLAEKLAEKKIPTGMHLYPFGVHGAGLAKDTVDTISWPREAAHFLQRAWGK